MDGYQLVVRDKGRTVLPVALREACGIEVGTPLVARPLGDGRFVVETRAAVLRRLRADAPADVDAVGELVAMRRREAEALEHRAAESHGGERDDPGTPRRTEEILRKLGLE